jgi:hypothetical protein
LGRLRQCWLDIDAANLDAALTRVVATRT